MAKILTSLLGKLRKPSTPRPPQHLPRPRGGRHLEYCPNLDGDAAMIRAANGLTDSMLAERPPNDGHRKNLLNTGFKRIGLSIVRDSKGVTWMTQDFVN